MKVGLAQMEQMKVGGEKEYTSCYRLQPLIFGGVVKGSVDWWI